MARIIVAAHKDHVDWISKNMRKADVEEVAAAGGKGPVRALSGSLERSAVAWTGMIDDRPVCMFGVSPIDILGGIGSPWLLGTDEIERCAVSFLRLNKRYVAQMLDLFPHLVNFVDARNKLSIKWLKWLGFRFDPEPVPYGIWDMDFYKFEMMKKPMQPRSRKPIPGASSQASQAV
jgi:hypothetical protein